MEIGMSRILLQYHSDRREEGGRGLGLSMSNALQVVTEALSSTTKLPPFQKLDTRLEIDPALHNEPDPESDLDPQDEEEEEDIPQAFHQTVTIQQHHQPQQQQQQQHHHHHPGVMGKTIVASDNDVTNGFVKDGKMLPYVFEANESGVRKRSSKILPVCGVCGKRFVCVTTMKRHLVTHTGEKPFSCKVCGKQYTQKGNLRVHERTHRNDRPFECNICHQKFYRKEPMQKHQWRQHGVVHFKTRPLPASGPTNNNNNNNNNNSSQSASIANESSYVDQINLQERPVENPSCYVRPLSDIVVAAATTRSPIPSVAHLLSTPVSNIPQAAKPANLEPFKLLPSSEILYQFSEKATTNDAQPQQSSFTSTPSTAYSTPPVQEELTGQNQSQDVNLISMETSHSSPKPIKLRMKFAYQKEQEDNHKREEEERHILEDEENDEYDCEGIPENLEELKLHSSGSSPTGLEQSDSRAPPTTDPFQCVGCCVIFAHKPALKAHQICPEEKERPFKCCKCGYKFRQKAHLQKHQWRIHRRRYCDNDDSAAATTITMQDIINHGVEKSLREIPIYHGKTSSKYYSEILGLEYAGSEDNTSQNSTAANDNQPLDLSPLKKNPNPEPTLTVPVIKIKELENNLLLSQPPLPRSPVQRPAETAQMPCPGQSTSSLSISPSSISVVESFPAWKKQRTEPATLESTTTHRTLPPISILQKPPLMSLISRKTDGTTYTSYKHSSWIRDTSSSSVATDLSTEKKSRNAQSPEILRDQLLRLQSQNARTV